MTYLVRKIEKADIPKLQKLMEYVFGDNQWKDIKRLGSMTNHSYKITRKNGLEYLVRIPGEGTEKMINRMDERKSTELGCKLGIDSKLIYFGNDGCKVMEFIPDPLPMSDEIMKKKEIIHKAAEILYKLHTCGVDTGVKFDVFEMAALYEKIIIENKINFFDDYKDIKQSVINIKNELNKTDKVQNVPCHNDTLTANWVLSKEGKLYLVDWEYSGMNDAVWDLSCLSIEANYNSSEDNELLNAYYDCDKKEVGTKERKRFIANKLYIDFLWALWGLTRIPFDGDYAKEYADGRYNRLKKNIKVYNKLEY